jgi:hypothetical protein
MSEEETQRYKTRNEQEYRRLRQAIDTILELQGETYAVVYTVDGRVAWVYDQR